MDSLDAITLLYLSKTWDGNGSLLEYAQKFQQTRDKLADILMDERSESLNKALNDASFTF